MSDREATRTCNTCGHVGPLDDFEPHARYKHGRMPYCRPCRAASRKRAEHGKNPDEVIRCSSCGERKPRHAFYSNGTKGQCKDCRRAASSARYHADRDRFAHENRAYRYGITSAQYDAMLAAQGGGCAICGRQDSGDPRRRYLSVDHDHRCCPGVRSCGDCVRGLLCTPCNTGIGHFEDREALLMAALAYLQLWGVTP